MRGSIFGRPPEQRGSVPSVRPDGPMGAPSGLGNGGAPFGGPGYRPDGQMPPPEPQGRGGSFLGTAAAAAAGAIGGSMLLDGIRSMTGARHGAGGFGLSDPAAAAGRGGSPWGTNHSSGTDDLARQAGVNDIGRSASSDPFGQSQGKFGEANLSDASGGKAGDADNIDHSATDDSDLDLDDSDDDFEGDFDGDFDNDE